MLIRGIRDWNKRYFKTQKQKKQPDCYFIYTQHDHEIPFRPEYDIAYTHIIPHLIFTAKHLARWCPSEDLKQALSSFMHANDISQKVYITSQTTMPRFTDHDRLTRGIAQKLDEPLNCCPSLHITY